MSGQRAHDNALSKHVHVHAGEGAVVRGELPEDDTHRVDLGATAVGLRGGHLAGWRVVVRWRRVVRWRVVVGEGVSKSFRS